MKQANNVKSKMASMMTCIKGVLALSMDHSGASERSLHSSRCLLLGLDAFSGSGTKRFDKDGAQQGFCHKSNVGFCLASW